MSCDDEQLELFPLDTANSPSATATPRVEVATAEVAPQTAAPGHEAATRSRPSRRQGNSAVSAPRVMPKAVPTVPHPRKGTGSLFLSIKEVAARYGVVRQTLWRWCKDPDLGFPAPISLASGTLRWQLDDLETYEQRKRALSSVGRK